MAAFAPSTIGRFSDVHRGRSDVRDLKLRTSTWSDAQNIFRRWGSWGHYDGTCTKEACTYRIELSDDFTNLTKHRGWPGREYESFYELLGGRPASVIASLTIADGLVWEKSFVALISVPPEHGPTEPFGGNGYGLIASSSTVSRFSYEWQELAAHRNYGVRTPAGCTFCQAVLAEFTPYADAADVQSLMNFELSCLTRRQPCKEPGEIMPDAWKRYRPEHQGNFRPSKYLITCDFPLSLLGRDTDNAAVVETVSRAPAGSETGTHVYQLRMVQRLKGGTFWDLNEIRAVPIADAAQDGGCALPETSPGTQFILLFHGLVRGARGKETLIDARTSIPLTPKNLAEVQTGIRQDFLSRH